MCMIKLLRNTILILSILITFCSYTYASSINKEAIQAMKAYKVPVVGYAIIDNYKVIKVDTISIDKSISVTNHSLFQAASISKSLSAYAALKVIENKKISLNSPVNKYLKNWKIPTNKYNEVTPVILRDLMDMTSGLSVSGFAGYPIGKPLPDALQVLNGNPPANNNPIRVFYEPSSNYFYSGGGFQVLQQFVTDQSKLKFNSFMNHNVLKEIGMNDSVFMYPLNSEYNIRAIPAFEGWSGSEIKGGWLNYACSGAGGMWSNPNDLAVFALSVTDSYLGKKNAYIAKKIAVKMLTRQKNTDFGLGVVVNGSGKNLYFWKAGHNYGYHSLVIMFPNTGKGFAIMTNSENGDTVINYLTAIVAKKYNWPYYFPFFDELVRMPYIEK